MYQVLRGFYHVHRGSSQVLLVIIIIIHCTKSQFFFKADLERANGSDDQTVVTFLKQTDGLTDI